MDEQNENSAQDMVECRSCERVTAVEDYHCTSCGEMVCLYCGCTEWTACADGCWWVRPGVCSECD